VTNELSEWRLLDTGILSGAENMALDDVILEGRAEHQTPNTLRFLQFRPSTVLVGYHQSVEQEVRVPFCTQNNVDINRRITGGGTILFTPTCLGWEIFADKTAQGVNELRKDLGKLAEFVSKIVYPVLPVGERIPPTRFSCQFPPGDSPNACL